MKTTMAAVLMIVCGCILLFSEEDNALLKRGSMIGTYIQELQHKYGEGKQVFEADSKTAGTRGKVLWKIGKGSLLIEMSMGAGTVSDMSYVIDTEGGQRKILFNVKNVDIAKGEMTVFLASDSELDENDPKLDNK